MKIFCIGMCYCSPLSGLEICEILFQFGSGPIKGFAVTLSIGLLVSLFTALFVTRTIFHVFLEFNLLKNLHMLKFFHDTNINFVSKSKMQSGTIARLTDSGYGFIAREGEEKDLFFHSNELQDVQFDELKEGDKVTFEVADGPKGPSATNVKRA